ncbi:MAG: SPOR domain-containing protein [Nitrospinota bacterium]
MADENGSYNLNDDSSLEKFEEELVREEKKKARSNFLLGILVLLIIGAIGFYGYTSIYAPGTPPPRKQAVKAVKPPPPAPVPQPVPVAEPETPMAEPTVEEKPAAPMSEIKEEPLVVEMKVKDPAELVEIKEVETVARTPEAKEETPRPEMTASASDGKTYTLQVGFFRIPGNAEIISKRLSNLNLHPRLKRSDFTVRKVKVYTGEFPYRETATKGAQMLANQGFNPKVALTGPGKYELEMGSFDKEEQADGLVRQIEDRNLKVRLETGPVKMNATVVRLENIDGTQRLDEIKEILKRENIDFFIVRR